MVKRYFKVRWRVTQKQRYCLVGLILSDIRRNFTIEEIVNTSKDKKKKEVLLKKNVTMFEINLFFHNFLAMLPKVLFCLDLCLWKSHKNCYISNKMAYASFLAVGREG